jgi:hypothetical protein
MGAKIRPKRGAGDLSRCLRNELRGSGALCSGMRPRPRTRFQLLIPKDCSSMIWTSLRDVSAFKNVWPGLKAGDVSAC